MWSAKSKQKRSACICSAQVLTIQSVSVLYEGLLTLGIGRFIWLGQLLAGPLGHVSLVEGLGETGHRHVLPVALALVVLLHTVNLVSVQSC